MRMAATSTIVALLVNDNYHCRPDFPAHLCITIRGFQPCRKIGRPTIRSSPTTRPVLPRRSKVHLERVYSKLQVSSRSAATLYAAQHGLVDAYEPEWTPRV